MLLLINSLLLIALAWFYYKKSGNGLKYIYWTALGFRIVMGVALGWIYLYYYTANDTWMFFKDASVLSDFAKSDFTGYLKFIFSDQLPDVWMQQLINEQERSLFLIKMMSVCAWMSGENYWITAVWFSWISFLAAWHLFRVVIRTYSQALPAAALSFLFFPSVVFWSSGLIKETLALAGLFFLAAVLIKILHRQKIYVWEWLLACFGFWVAWSLKYYWAAVFGAILFTTIMIYLGGKRWKFISSHTWLSWTTLFVLLCLGVSFLHPNFHLSRFLNVLVTNHNDFLKISDHGLIHYYNLQASWWSVLINAPWALFSGLFRPFIWEASGITALLAAIENLVLLVLMFAAIKNVKRKDLYNLLLYSIVAFVLVLCIFLALSTPNLGTLSRYRVGFLPFLVFVITYRNKSFEYLLRLLKITWPVE